MSEGSNQHNIRVVRIYDNPCNLPRVVESDVLPRCAGVRALVHSVAGGQVRTQIGFAGSHVDRVRIGRRECDGADRGNVLRVEDRIPRYATVRRPPYSAAHRAKIVDVGISRYAGDGDGASTTKGPNKPPTQPLVELGIKLLCVSGGD